MAVAQFPYVRPRFMNRFFAILLLVGGSCAIVTSVTEGISLFKALRVPDGQTHYPALLQEAGNLVWTGSIGICFVSTSAYLFWIIRREK